MMASQDYRDRKVRLPWSEGEQAGYDGLPGLQGQKGKASLV